MSKIKLFYVFVHTNGEKIQYLGHGVDRVSTFRMSKLEDATFSSDINVMRNHAKEWVDLGVLTPDERICIGCLDADTDPFFPIEVVK